MTTEASQILVNKDLSSRRVSKVIYIVGSKEYQNPQLFNHDPKHHILHQNRTDTPCGKSPKGWQIMNSFKLSGHYHSDKDYILSKVTCKNCKQWLDLRFNEEENCVKYTRRPDE